MLKESSGKHLPAMIWWNHNFKFLFASFTQVLHAFATDGAHCAKVREILNASNVSFKFSIFLLIHESVKCMYSPCTFLLWRYASWNFLLEHLRHLKLSNNGQDGIAIDVKVREFVVRNKLQYRDCTEIIHTLYISMKSGICFGQHVQSLYN